MLPLKFRHLNRAKTYYIVSAVLLAGMCLLQMLVGWGKAPKDGASSATSQSNSLKTLDLSRDSSTIVDPQAKKLVNQMLASYKRLRSYSDVTDVRFIGERPQAPIRATTTFQAPAKIAVTENSLEGKTVRISDGVTYYRQSPNPEKKYLKEPVLRQYGTLALMQQFPAGRYFTGMLAGIDPFLAPWGRAPKTLVLAKPGIIDNVPVHILVAQFVQGSERELVSYQMGTKDLLLRRIVVTTYNPNGSKNIMVETHSNVKVNPTVPPATFTFTPPKGWKAVARLQPPTWSSRLQAGAQPIPINAVDTVGRPFSLDQQKGKATLLVFWATWCGFCKKEMPHIMDVSRKYKSKGLEVVGISLDHKRSELEKFIQENQLPWRQICDEKGWNGNLVRQYGVRSIPFSVLIGRDGKVAALNMSRLQFEAAVASELGQPDKKSLAAESSARKVMDAGVSGSNEECTDCGTQ